MTLMPVADALDQLRAAARVCVTTRERPLGEAMAAVLAEDLRSPVSVPPSDNSAMDGYAVEFADSERLLSVSQRVPAGACPAPLQAGTAARIFTGAPIPPGADAVVAQEQVEPQGDQVHMPAVARGANIRRRGQDVAAGDVVIPAGTRLTPWHLGLAASVGVASLTVHEPLTVALFSTGDELQEPGEAPREGAIYNSNRYLLKALLARCQCRVVDLGVVADTPAATRDALEQAAASADVIISTGGVSVGEEDHVRAAVTALGELALWKLAIKPGKPFAFGRVAETFFLGLPGNPASALVTFLVLVKPFLDACAGRCWPSPLPLPVAAGWHSDRVGSRQEYLRVQLQGQGEQARLVPHPNQSSGMLSSACWADGLAVVPAGTAVSEGMLLAFHPFSQLLD
ncbi:MAG: gephyrin-like molybdotransferase Glp [Alcanivoracaceae bacterium]